jgi:hypothetical protein
MIKITSALIQDSGGLLQALIYKSAEFIESIIGRENIKGLGGKERYLRRIITHANPHLDEYVADLLLTAALPRPLRAIPFEEQTIFSRDDDADCKLTWPSSVVLGMGASVSGGANPLVLFDEHSEDATRAAASCCQMAADALFQRLPESLSTLLHEANSIDQFGSAHDQNLGNIIKDFHEVRFAFARDAASGEEVSDFLTPEWKRALVHACLTAVVYCLENGIDLRSEPEAKVQALSGPLELYRSNNLRRGHAMFKSADERTKGLYLNAAQERVFKEAGLKAKVANRVVTQKDSSGQEVPQLLIASRVIYACRQCWGEGIATLIALHIFEVEYQAQLNFKAVFQEIKSMFDNRYSEVNTPIGLLEQSSLPPVFIKGVRKQRGFATPFEGSYPLIVIGVSPDPGVIKPNRAARSFINKEKSGLGIILVNDTTLGTKAVFKCDNTPYPKWAKLCAALQDLEPNSWSWQQSAGQGYDYILNGTRAHRHMEPSSLTFRTLARLLKSTFY